MKLVCKYTTVFMAIMCCICFLASCFIASAEEKEGMPHVTATVNTDARQIEISCTLQGTNNVITVTDEDGNVVYADMQNGEKTEYTLLFNCLDFEDGGYLVSLINSQQSSTAVFEINRKALKITRGEFAYLAAEKFYGAEEETDVSFPDTENAPCAYHAGILKKHGVFEGFEDGTFRPDDVLTTLQLAVAAYRILEDKTDCDIGVPDTENVESGVIPHWAQAGFSVCLDRELLKCESEIEAFSDVTFGEAEILLLKLADLAE